MANMLKIKIYQPILKLIAFKIRRLERAKKKIIILQIIFILGFKRKAQANVKPKAQKVINEDREPKGLKVLFFVKSKGRIKTLKVWSKKNAAKTKFEAKIPAQSDKTFL